MFYANGATIWIGWEIQCFMYAGFVLLKVHKKLLFLPKSKKSLGIIQKIGLLVLLLCWLATVHEVFSSSFFFLFFYSFLIFKCWVVSCVQDISYFFCGAAQYFQTLNLISCNKCFWLEGNYGTSKFFTFHLFWWLTNSLYSWCFFVPPLCMSLLSYKLYRMSDDLLISEQ